MERWEIGIEATLKGPLSAGLSLRVRLHTEDAELSDDRYGVSSSELARRVVLSDPGIDDYRNELLWSPSHPQLIAATVELLRTVDGIETVIDRVLSYTALGLNKTGVDSEHTATRAASRGQGLATLVKATALAWAREQGYATASTGGNVANLPMLRVNTRLGYRPEPMWLTWVRDLPAGVISPA